MILSILTWFQSALITPQVHTAATVSAAPVERVIRTPKRRISFSTLRTPQTQFPGWNGDFVSRGYSKSSKYEQLKLKSLTRLLRTSLLSLPAEHRSALKKLELRNEMNPSRGLANSTKMVLNARSTQSEDELRSVFIHEMGHLVDLGEMTGKHGTNTAFRDGKKRILSDDLSVQFYQMSWRSADMRRENISDLDFVSGYARTNCFEDFAESYLMYRLHGEKFRALSAGSDVLKQKYEFLRDEVFGGQEYNTARELAHPGEIWDATLLPL